MLYSEQALLMVEINFGAIWPTNFGSRDIHITHLTIFGRNPDGRTKLKILVKLYYYNCGTKLNFLQTYIYKRKKKKRPTIHVTLGLIASVKYN